MKKLIILVALIVTSCSSFKPVTLAEKEEVKATRRETVVKAATWSSFYLFVGFGIGVVFMQQDGR